MLFDRAGNGNTGDDRVLKLNMASNAISVFAESINGADGSG